MFGFGFSVGPHGLSTEQCQAWVPSHGIGLKSNPIVVGCVHNVCTSIALAFYAGKALFPW